MDQDFAAPLLTFTLSRDRAWTSAPPYGSKSESESESESVSRGRTGVATFSDRSTGVVEQRTETPALIALAPRGSVSHLTRDNLVERGQTRAVHLSLEHFLDFQPPRYSTAPFGLDHFIGLSRSQRSRSRSTTGEENDASEDDDARVLISMSLRDPTLTAIHPDDDDDNAKTARNPVNVPTNGDRHAVALGGSGIVKVSPRDYLDWTLARPPDVLFALADEPLAVVDDARTNLFATLMGNHDFDRRIEFSKRLVAVPAADEISTRPGERGANASMRSLDHDLAGYVLSVATAAAATNDRAPSSSSSLDSEPGSHPTASSMTTTTTARVEEGKIAALFEASLAPLPSTKPRIVTGLFGGPHEILRLIDHVGIDFVVESWSQDCATWGVALDFEFPVPIDDDDDDNGERDDETNNVQGEQRRVRPQREVGINLFDPVHRFSFERLSNSPLASSSRNQKQGGGGGGGGGGQDVDAFGPLGSATKSYVHHLLLAHEMTSHVILALHNQQVMVNFFASIRSILDLDDDHPGAGERGGGGGGGGRGGQRRFKHEVERFERTYRDREPRRRRQGGGGGEYKVVVEAREHARQVERLRGKGSSRDKEVAATLAVVASPENGSGDTAAGSIATGRKTVAEIGGVGSLANE
ncbi:hypothetical protein JCM3766R1_000894 [Sporobolomyces carnicolor]